MAIASPKTRLVEGWKLPIIIYQFNQFITISCPPVQGCNLQASASSECSASCSIRLHVVNDHSDAGDLLEHGKSDANHQRAPPFLMEDATPQEAWPASTRRAISIPSRRGLITVNAAVVTRTWAGLRGSQRIFASPSPLALKAMKKR